MIEAVKIWNEPNNKSHWDPNLDPEWDLFAGMTRLAGQAIAAEAPGQTRVLGGMSPIDPHFLGRLEVKGVLDQHPSAPDGAFGKHVVSRWRVYLPTG